MVKTKGKAPKTTRVTNEQIEAEVLNPIITAGLVIKPESVPLTEDEIKRLTIRKKLELDLIKQYDKTTVTLHECWFIIDSNWLNKWSEFVHSTDENTDNNIPDKISTQALFDENGKLLKNLQCKIDYRAVPPLVYFIFVNLYGRDKSPEIARYLIDIYGIDVELSLAIKVRYAAQKEAACLVNQIRPQWVSWEIYDDEDDEDDKSCCWGYITKEHLEAFIYWAVRCWASRTSQRKGIKYSQYRPLKGKDDSPDTDTPSSSSSSSSSMDNTSGDVEMAGRNGNEMNATEIDTSSEFPDRDYDTGVWFRRYLFRW